MPSLEELDEELRRRSLASLDDELADRMSARHEPEREPVPALVRGEEKRVRVFAPDGTPGSVPELELDDALAEGFRTEQQVRQEALEREYGGLGGKAATAAESALGTGSLGFTDLVSSRVQGALLGRQLDAEGYRAPQLTPEARARIGELNRQRSPDQQIELPPQLSNYDVGVETAQREAARRAEANPTTAAISQAVGAIAPLALSGGTGLLARGGAVTPAALVERAGAALTSRLAGPGAGLLRTAAAGAAGGALSGEIANLALEASRMPAADIQDPAKAAEHLVSTIGQGALLGGGLGAVFAGGGRLLRGGAGALDELGAKVGRTEAPAGAQAAPRGVDAPPSSTVEAQLGALDHLETQLGAGARAGSAKQVSEAVDREAGAILNDATTALESRPLSAAQLPEPPRGKWQARAEQAAAAGGKFDEAVQAGTASLRKDFDEALRSMNKIDEFGGIAAKRKANAYNVGHPVSSAEVDGLLTDLEGQILQWQGGRSRQGLQSGGGLAALESVKKSLRENGVLIRSAFQRGDIGEAYSLLDQGVKSFIGKARAGTKSEPVRDLLEGLYPRVQNFLEDESAWGPLAARQKVANPAWSARIAASLDGRVQQFTTLSGERAANNFDNIRLANAGALKNLLNNVGDAGAADVEEAFRTQLRALARDATDRTRAWGGKELRDEARRVVGAVGRMEDTLDRVALLRRDKLAHEASLKGSTIEMIGQLAGAAGQTPIAAAIGATVAAKRKLAQLLGAASTPEAKAAIAGAMPPPTTLENTVRAGAESMAAGLARSAATLLRAADARTKGVAAAAPFVAGAMLSEKRHQQALEEAQTLSDPNSPATRALVEQAAELERESPELADAYASLTLRRANYIASKLPQNTSAAVFAPKPLLDPVTDRSLRRTVAAAYSPQAAIDRLAELRGSHEDAETVNALFPSMFREFQQRVLQAMSPGKLKLNYDTRIALSFATGLPFDPSMESEQLQFQQQIATGPDRKSQAEAAFEQQNQSVASQFKPVDSDQVFAPRVDQLLDRR